jgi:hypothetical protein
MIGLKLVDIGMLFKWVLVELITMPDLDLISNLKTKSSCQKATTFFLNKY